MASPRLKGNRAEDIAAAHLKKLKMKIITRNYQAREGEIDIIAREGDVLCIVEVRSRGKESPYVPEASLSPKKVRHLTNITKHFIRRHKLFNVPVRFDLMVIDWQTGDPEIRFHPGGIRTSPLT